MNWCIIANPHAAGGTAREQVKDWQRLLPDAEVRWTERPGHGEELARAASDEGFEAVLAAGGDGTLNEVVNGLMRADRRAQLGILPLGTGNDFCRNLNPSPEPEEVVEALRQPARPCDVVHFRGSRKERYFINASAAGFSGQMGENLNEELKQAWGPLAYFRAALETLPELAPFSLHLTFDDGEVIEEPILNLVVANGRYVAGGIPAAPEARFDDGKVDVVLFRPSSIASLLLLAPKVLAGAHLEEPLDERLLYRRTRRLEVASLPRMPLNVDGELVGEEDQFEYKVEAGALELLGGGHESDP